MDKIRRILLFVSIYILVFSATCFASFDDIKGHWAEKEIADFEESGVVEGYLDGTFKPDQDITKAEFCKIINKYMNYNVSGDWKTENINIAKEKGYLIVNNCDETITREEAFVALARLMKLENIEIELNYIDSGDISVWAMPSIKALTETAYIKGFPNKEIKPKQNMKRAELVSILYKYIGIGGVDIEELKFSVGYMDSNAYGLEYKEIVEKINIKVGDILQLASTVSSEDGDVEFNILSGENIIELDKDFLTIEALNTGSASIVAITTETKKEKTIEIIVE